MTLLFPMCLKDLIHFDKYLPWFRCTHWDSSHNEQSKYGEGEELFPTLSDLRDMEDGYMFVRGDGNARTEGVSRQT